MSALYAVYAAVVLGTIVFALVRRPGVQAWEIFRLRETWMTVVLGVALWAESGALLYVLLTIPERLGGGQPVQTTWLFMAVSLLLGSFSVLFGAVKVVVVRTDGFCAVSASGTRTDILWEQVAELQNARKRLRFVTADGRTATVGGNRPQMTRFLRHAAKHIHPEAGEDVLEALLRQYR